MATVTGGRVLARALAAEQVHFLFGLPSPESDPLLAELDEAGIRFVPVRHEAAGVHMAEGLYKTTGEVAAVLGNPGPGSANLIPGVVTARHEGVPVLVLTSQHRLGVVYPTPPSTFQGQDQLDLFRPAVKWGGPVFEWGRIAEVVRLACREMWAGRPGPVQIELPAPVLYEEGEESSVALLSPSQYRPSLPQASEAQLAEVAALLRSARRPLVVAGSGVDRAGANEALVAVVERLGCPVMTSTAGRSSVSSLHPNYLSGLGDGGAAARREADVVLVCGSRLGNLDLPFDKYWGDPALQRVVQIDLDPRHLGVTRPITLGLVAEIGQALEGLGRHLEGHRPPADLAEAVAGYRAADRAATERLLTEVLAGAGEGIHPALAATVVGTVAGPDAIYVVDGGNTALWAYASLPSTRPRSYHSILELGMLGTGIPQAIGAKLGAPDRRVVCLTGDGAAGFHAMELQTAAREHLDLTVVVFAEGSWTMEELNERARYGRTFGTEQGEIRWDTVAEGLGCHGEYVDEMEKLQPALERAIATDGPAVVCLRTDHDANLAVPAEIGDRFFEVYSGPTPTP